MKRVVFVALVLGLLAISALAIGCGSKETTTTTPEGEVTIEKDGDESVTFRSDEGDYTYDVSEGAPTEAQLGAPIYPKAEYVPGSGGVVSGGGEEGFVTTAGAEFVTKDSFDKVLDWYTDKLGAPMYTSMGTPQEASWMSGMGEEDVVVVSITSENGEVSIVMGRMSG